MPFNTDEDDLYNVICEKRFLQEHISEKVNIFLTNGTKLEAEIREYDDIVIVASQKGINKNKKQLIYKTAISSIAEI